MKWRKTIRVVFFFVAAYLDIGFNSFMAIKTIFRSSKGKLLSGLPTKLVVYLAALILLVSLIGWWRHTQTSPDRIFWGMVNRSLNTTAFSRTLQQEGDMQKLTQVVSVRTAPQHLANSTSVITQGEPVTTRVVTESIGTPFTDFVRYADITTSQKTASGQAPDFSKVKGVWGEAENTGSNVTNGQLYTESVLGVIPIGSLSADKQKVLIDQIKQSGAYKYSLTNVERKGLFQRPRYTYDVQVSPVAYISTLKSFAADLGLTHLQTVNPAQYQSAQPVSVQIVIDGWSRQLLQVSYGGGSRVEKYSGYNNVAPLNGAPKDSIPISQLQARLQTLE